MRAMALDEIISLISDLNTFADNSEKLIFTTQSEYENEKRALLNRFDSELIDLEDAYNRSFVDMSTRSNNTIIDAQRILEDICDIDNKLSSVDKYYVKTKRKKEEQLSGVTSTKYSGASDYFAAMGKIRLDYRTLYLKYSQDILPGLLNGLNYIFSSQRKRDYEDLIVLKNTVSSFVGEIKTTLPGLLQETKNSMSEELAAKKNEMIENHNKALNRYEIEYSHMLDRVADKICNDLENILPDEFITYFRDMINSYAESVYSVNSTTQIQNDVLGMLFVDYPVDDLVQSQIVSSFIKDKCSALIFDRDIRFPMMISTVAPYSLTISSNKSNESDVLSLMHSIMYTFLSSSPVSRIKYDVVDPENRGNSVTPFFDAKKKMPELFGDKIIISREDIASEINRLNERIENILQEKLGNQYATIYDYAKDHSEYTVTTELLLLFDFPKGFDEHLLGELRNILRSGGRCGIYTVIAYVPNSDNEFSSSYSRAVKSILDLSYVVQQTDYGFVFRGLPISYFSIPEKKEFMRFFSKYLLIYEGIKHQGIAFSPMIRRLVNATNMEQIKNGVLEIQGVRERFNKSFACVSQLDNEFSSEMTIGDVLYPADIFAESIGYEYISDIFGNRVVSGSETSVFIDLPMTFNLKNTFNLFLESTDNSQAAINRFTHHIMLCFLSGMPVSKVNICVFDSEQRGNSITPFLDFRKKCPEVFDQKIYTSSEAITDRLRKLNEYIDDFIQQKLGEGVDDIFDYNANASRRSESMTLLVIYDFPSGLDSRGLDLLMKIIQNGNKCGVFTIICYNPSITYSHYDSIGERLEKLQKYCSHIAFKDGHYSLLPYNLQIIIPQELSVDRKNAFFTQYYERNEIIKKQGLSFREIISKDLFMMDSSNVLSIPVGVGDGDSIVSIVMGTESSHHGLIAGATGSGKSTFLHTLIMSCMLNYTPDQLHLYLMDFKSGTEFKVYETVRLPHIKLLAIDAMQEFGESILENLVQEMERRADLFKNEGNNATSVAEYKRATGEPLPRILVIMDEFQILFNDATNRKVAMNCAELTKRLVTEGRAFGIHLLMATQSTKVITDLTLSPGTIEQMRIRVGLKCGENDARYLFSDKNDMKALSMMKGPIGTAVLNLDFTEKANIGFRVAYCDDKTQRELLNRISEKFADTAYTLKTFEGSRTVELLDYYREQGIGLTDELPVKIHMGTLIKVAPPLCIELDRKKKHNMLICGANEKMSSMIVNDYIVSALLNSNTSVYCIDGDILVEDDDSNVLYSKLRNRFDRFKSAEDRSDIIKFINEIYEKYQLWKKHKGNQVVIVVFKNLQFLDIVQTMFKGERFDESEYVDDEQPSRQIDSSDPFAALNDFLENKADGTDISAGEKLLKMITDGSGYGIHFVVSSLEYQSVKECMYYGENILTKFPERVVFSLNNNDAESLINNIAVSGLRDNTVYYSDGIRNIYQMKPYVFPSIEQLDQFLSQ